MQDFNNLQTYLHQFAKESLHGTQRRSQRTARKLTVANRRTVLC
jgi:hypothetical protein